MSPTPAKARTSRLHEIERRLHARYPIASAIQYKLVTSGEKIGVGKTLNVSSGGVLFEATDALPARSQVEVVIDWPVQREGAGTLKLVMHGLVIRSNSKLVAAQVSRYEFRT